MSNELDNIIISAFANKCNQIYKLNREEKEYWLIVADAYSKEVDDIYGIYFCLLDKGYDYFHTRIISEDELSSFLYMKPTKIY